VDELLSEKEQIEAIRSWWRENGRYVISGIVIGVGLLFGWRYWNNQQQGDQLAASDVYESLLAEVADTDVAAAEEVAQRLYGEFESTVYAVQGRLAMSRIYMDTGRDEDAAEALRRLLAGESDPQIALLARLRLAKILLYQDKPADALALLGTPGESALAARFHDVIDDAHSALGNVAEAGAAWSRALADEHAQHTVNTRYVRMKVDDLPDPAATRAAAELPQDGEGE